MCLHAKHMLVNETVAPTGVCMPNCTSIDSWMHILCKEHNTLFTGTSRNQNMTITRAHISKLTGYSH